MSEKGKKPNILFLFSDQQRWDTCGCYGQPLDITPNLDRMASEGVKFENAFTCQPVCGPARASIQTGKYAAEVGCFTNNIKLPFDEKTMAHYLSNSGYEVGYVGKWHLASSGPADCSDNFRTKPVPMERRGGYKDFWLAADCLEFTSHSYDGYMFDQNGNKREFPEGRYRVDAETDWVLEYLQNRNDENKPFFLFVSYLEPHQQNDHMHYEGPHGSKERFKNFTVPNDLKDLQGDWGNEYPDYLGCVNSLDKNVGRIIAELESQGILEDTLIIYTSDHGSHFMTRNGEYKRACHESCIRVPMIIRGPGFKSGKTVEELVSLINLPPTVLVAGGEDVPETMRERPLQELISNETDWQEEVFLQISESQTGRAIRTKRWKYSVRAPEKPGEKRSHCSNVYMEDFLYDLEADPYEMNNLVKDPVYAEVRAELAERLKARMAKAKEDIPEIIPAS
jgi:uncharacterized sulfatase